MSIMSMQISCVLINSADIAVRLRMAQARLSAYSSSHAFDYLYMMSNERHMRAKRSSFVINVVETSNGFSVIEGIELLNKPEGIAVSQQPLQPASTHHSAHSVAAIKEYRPVFKKTSLVFLKGKEHNAFDPQTAEEELVQTPEACKLFAQWFDLNKIHQIERRQVLEWFCEKSSCSAEEGEEREEFGLCLRTYRKHRNFIVKLYDEEFAAEQRYLSASCIRRYLSCDSFWVMKLHLLLSNLGVINSHNPAFSLEASNKTHIFRTSLSGKRELLAHQLTTNRRSAIDSSPNEVLKKLTRELRPYCDYCRIHCGIVWFQHTRSLDPKEIANIMKNVNSKNPPLSQKEYEYILCVRCYCESNFPLLLTHHDFKKICVNDRLDPGRKKRNKRKKREKRRREEGAPEEDDEGKEENEEKSHLEDEEEGERKKEEINATISKLIASLHVRKWTLEETECLLELVQKHEENWAAVHEDLKKKGYCKDIDTEQLILYFLTLPERGVVQLSEEYEDEQFVEANFSNNRISIQDRLSERKLNDSVQFSFKASDQLIDEMTRQASQREFEWKANLQKVMRLLIKKYGSRIENLQQCEAVVKSLRVFSDCK